MPDPLKITYSFNLSKFIGVVKVFIIIALLAALIFVTFSSFNNNKSLLVKLNTLFLIYLLFFFPIYYLMKTAYWDLYTNKYMKNKIAFIGLIVFSLLTVSFIYSPIQLGVKDLFWSNALFGIALIAIEIRDFKKIIAANRNNKTEEQKSSEGG